MQHSHTLNTIEIQSTISHALLLLGLIYKTIKRKIKNISSSRLLTCPVPIISSGNSLDLENSNSQQYAVIYPFILWTVTFMITQRGNVWWEACQGLLQLGHCSERTPDPIWTWLEWSLYKLGQPPQHFRPVHMITYIYIYTHTHTHARTHTHTHTNTQIEIIECGKFSPPEASVAQW